MSLYLQYMCCNLQSGEFKRHKHLHPVKKTEEYKRGKRRGRYRKHTSLDIMKFPVFLFLRWNGDAACRQGRLFIFTLSCVMFKLKCSLVPLFNTCLVFHLHKYVIGITAYFVSETVLLVNFFLSQMTLLWVVYITLYQSLPLHTRREDYNGSFSPWAYVLL